MDHLGFVEAVDRLGESVVVAVADAADGRLDAGLGEPLGVADRDVLQAAVRVMNEPTVPDGTARVESLLQGIQHEAGMSGARDPPADGSTGEDIDDEGYVDEAGPGRHVGEIRHPQGVRMRRLELPVQSIERAGRGGPGTVVRIFRPRTAPSSPMVRIRRATVHRATAIPSRPSWRQIFRTP